jgi:RNA polymerase sigma factor (sigma-70 family)
MDEWEVMAQDSPQNIVGTVKQYGKRLFGFIRGRVKTDEDAEDILQDVWYQLSNVNNIGDIEQMSGWLFQVARNRIIDRSRKKTTDLLEDLIPQGGDDDFSLADILLADDTTPEDEYIKTFFWQELLDAIEELPEKQQQVFVMNELEDKTLQQIADETGENIKTIISRKGYAVKHLRQRLETLYNELLNY